ncbi:HAMP domain-containing histidine kinase [Thiothrix subterranea]|uniref:sensor histidine kinase n=1 Tax=Thiothrix subterranea TaxID=2735563 RepID=UPI00192B4EB9|nr:HAMP domain-containing sensor histidine kinase [Thiothrix subterranea]QQZ29540.1 HAMP domain-containing histidine kinase [Thiothrix subterranea]
MISIHRKITLAFSTLAVLAVGVATFTSLDLLFLQQRVEDGMAISRLETTVQDMRREEKNLFLYQDANAGDAAGKFAELALKELNTSPKALAKVGSILQLGQLRSGLQEYQKLLKLYLKQLPVDVMLENQIRNQGHNLSQLAENLALHERELLRLSIENAKSAQVIGIAIFAILLLLVGWRLDRSVIKPVKQLMQDLNPIAEGRFDRLETDSSNTEMISLREAFNRMLDELEARRRRLIQSEKLAAIGILVSGVAHELNNPLSNISSSCQLLLEELDTADHASLQDWAQTIDNETERARRIVDALLDFGRRQEPHLEQVNLADLLERTLLLIRGQVRKTGATVHTHIPLDLMLLADPQRLQQVFINLLRNAAESSENLDLHVRAKGCSFSGTALPSTATVVGELGCHLNKRQPMIEIIIEDNGPGIPPDTLPRIFEPFFTTREPGHGMGLGLYIVQEIIQEHGGCIAIASQPGQGTRVVLRLPCREHRYV